MNVVLGVVLGTLFGALLQLAGASSHTKIVNALRLRDFTIFKVILTGIGVGMIGVQALDAFGWAHLKVKDVYVLGLIEAGLVFGVGFALTGYCPGTALAATAEGKLDALVTVSGGLVGALTFAFVFPEFEDELLAVGFYGPVTLPDWLGVRGLWLAVPLGGAAIWLASRLPGEESRP